MIWIAIAIVVTIIMHLQSASEADKKSYYNPNPWFFIGRFIRAFIIYYIIVAFVVYAFGGTNS